MSATVAQDLAARTNQLPDDFYHHLIHTLRLTLPAPVTDNPDDLRRRDNAAIARIAALVPANAAEADTAARYVAASEQWKDCLRLAQLPQMSQQQAMRCRAQANAMMRQAQGALRVLLRMQTIREKREATNQSCDRAAFTEQCAINFMLEALGPPSNGAEPRAGSEPLPDPLASTERGAPLSPYRSPLMPLVAKGEAELVHSSRPAPHVLGTIDAATLPAFAPAPGGGRDAYGRNQSERKDQARPPSTRRTRLVPNGISLDLPAGDGFRPS